MTVKELKEKLEAMPQELEVTTNYYDNNNNKIVFRLLEISLEEKQCKTLWERE